MTEQSSAVTEVIRDYYRAYETSDITMIDKLVSDDFTFTSPMDDHIDRATYFAKCWPGHEHLRTFNLLQVSIDGSHALIRYLAESTDGSTFCNVEHFEFDDELRVKHVDVYFGSKEPHP
jgi:ketosteroid isomerase-like protein